MEWLPIALLFAACPVGMGLMMWFMMRGQHQGKVADHQGAISPEDRLAQLEAEKRVLEQHLASPEERLARLEAEKRALEKRLLQRGDGKVADGPADLREAGKVAGG